MNQRILISGIALIVLVGIVCFFLAGFGILANGQPGSGFFDKNKYNPDANSSLEHSSAAPKTAADKAAIKAANIAAANKAAASKVAAKNRSAAITAAQKAAAEKAKIAAAAAAIDPKVAQAKLLALIPSEGSIVNIVSATTGYALRQNEFPRKKYTVTCNLLEPKNPNFQFTVRTTLDPTILSFQCVQFPTLYLNITPAGVVIIGPSNEFFKLGLAPNGDMTAFSMQTVNATFKNEYLTFPTMYFETNANAYVTANPTNPVFACWKFETPPPSTASLPVQ